MRWEERFEFWRQAVGVRGGSSVHLYRSVSRLTTMHNSLGHRSLFLPQVLCNYKSCSVSSRLYVRAMYFKREQFPQRDLRVLT